jgi:hypothetical protein
MAYAIMTRLVGAFFGAYSSWQVAWIPALAFSSRSFSASASRACARLGCHGR